MLMFFASLTFIFQQSLLLNLASDQKAYFAVIAEPLLLDRSNPGIISAEYVKMQKSCTY